MRRKKFIVLYTLFLFMAVFAMMNISDVFAAEESDTVSSEVSSGIFDTYFACRTVATAE